MVTQMLRHLWPHAWPHFGSSRCPDFSTVFVCLLAAVYMAISSALITFNKYLMHEDRFPFAIFIGGVHMVSCFSFNVILFLLRPSFYPSLTDPAQKVSLNLRVVARVLLPIATCFAAQLTLSNMAFMGSSVAFLQMMKQSNVVLVYMFSLFLQLEQFNWKRVGSLLLVFMATALTIHGEMQFSRISFTLQAISMLCESVKLTLQSHSLSASGLKLDALTYVMLISPLVMCIFSVLLLALGTLWPGRPIALAMPSWALIVEYRWLLLASGGLGVGMNIVHALFIKNSSAIVFILTGVIMKDVVIVSVGALLLGELLSLTQVLGFGMQLVGVAIYSFLKVAPSLVKASSKVQPESESIALTLKEEMEQPLQEKPSRLSSVTSASTISGPSDDGAMDDDNCNEGFRSPYGALPFIEDETCQEGL